MGTVGRFPHLRPSGGRVCACPARVCAMCACVNRCVRRSRPKQKADGGRRSAISDCLCWTTCRLFLLSSGALCSCKVSHGRRSKARLWLFHLPGQDTRLAHRHIHAAFCLMTVIYLDVSRYSPRVIRVAAPPGQRGSGKPVSEHCIPPISRRASRSAGVSDWLIPTSILP